MTQYRSLDATLHHMPLGATLVDNAACFKVFCSTTRNVSVKVYDADRTVLSTHPLTEIYPDRYAARIEGVTEGMLYEIVVDGRGLPDPYARCLPYGVHGPAMVVNPRFTFRYALPAREPGKHVIYELHVGTFTEEGTFAAAQEKLGYLADLGITTVELMPVNAFAGERGWGYDGVALYAVYAPYGSPNQLKSFIDEAHRLGLSVLLDVVYNHFGPAGNYLAAYSPDYFSKNIRTGWGDAPDFGHQPMRAYALENARYWLEEFRFDGLRLDATHAIVDRSKKHFLRELHEMASAMSPPRLLIAEDERNDPALIEQHGVTAVWADDFHHQIRVTCTQERDGYYAEYQPAVARIAEAIEGGWLRQRSVTADPQRGESKTASTLDASAFVYCIQNHDQIGNRAFGQRITDDISIDLYQALSTLLLFLPMTPLLFMGQEWAARTPFLYFTDHEASLGAKVSEGRRNEFKAFEAFSDPQIRASIPDPQDARTFQRSKLDWKEPQLGEPHQSTLQLYKRLLALRASDEVLSRNSRRHLRVSANANVLRVDRWSGNETRTLFVNFDAGPVDHDAPPDMSSWLSTRSQRATSKLPGHCAVIYRGSNNPGSRKVGDHV